MIPERQAETTYRRLHDFTRLDAFGHSNDYLGSLRKVSAKTTYQETSLSWTLLDTQKLIHFCQHGRDDPFEIHIEGSRHAASV
jgi:hypothetical protein